MISPLNKLYFKCQIILLRVYKPTVLFDRINQLGWYKKTLRQWFDDQGFGAASGILEVGCASGALTAYIARSGCTPVGADFSDNMLELARGKSNGIEFVRADVCDLPFTSEQFDGVIAASLINIVENKQQALNELLRVCKKGGRVAILVPLADFSDADLQSLQIALGHSGFSYAALNAWHRLPPKMTLSDITELYKQAGFTDMTSKQYLQGMVVSVSALKPA